MSIARIDKTLWLLVGSAVLFAGSTNAAEDARGEIQRLRPQEDPNLGCPYMRYSRSMSPPNNPYFLRLSYDIYGIPFTWGKDSRRSLSRRGSGCRP